MKGFGNIGILLTALLLVVTASAQQTEKQYLSGTGNDHTVAWDFYCTGGRNAGKWSTIAVPSCWELQGFGKYNYGFDKDTLRGKEQGLYKHTFRVPAAWKGKTIKLVFEGVMTDAVVKVNGKLAGAKHEGAFYAFKYDITKLLKTNGDNLLEVTVNKHSANKSVNEAERKADYWIFGGIFRPVYLEAYPENYIERVAINAKDNGLFTATVEMQGTGGGYSLSARIYTTAGKQWGPMMKGIVNNKFSLAWIHDSLASPALWSPEFPNLYDAVITLLKDGKPVHSVKQRFGFRTVEVKQRDGIYVNGVKVKMKGVNHHSFYPASGRTTSKAVSIADVKLMKDMNMNAVRMSHYPPDDHLLDVCDSLGLFVMDELAGWHGNYDSVTGTKLVKEMLVHDVNHPSIIFWSNGNEGGHNFALDGWFAFYDPQQRPVLHPWQLFGGFDTQHYRDFNYGIGNYNNGREIVMPTEFLHGLYDGGHGAGLEDYWESMWYSPLSAGGFLWDFADAGVVRTDKNGIIDTDGNHGADGIVGPYHEREGSYYTIKEVWSPVHVERREIAEGFDGVLHLENRYHYTNLNQCTYAWKLVQWKEMESVTVQGTATAPDVKPGAKGDLSLSLPADWQQYDALLLTITDPHGQALFTWSFAITRPSIMAQRMVPLPATGKVQVQTKDSLYVVTANGVTLSIHQRTGLLTRVQNAKGTIPFNNGPVLQDGFNNFSAFALDTVDNNVVITSRYNKKDHFNTLEWTIYPSGWVKMKVNYFPAAYNQLFLGVNFSFPEKDMKAVDYMGAGPYRVWKNRLKGTQLGVWHKDYNTTETGEEWIYPEFRGYHANLYWCRFTTTGLPFTVVAENEDTILRLFTPAFKTDPWKNYEPRFPSGDISFMQGIAGIGTKTQRSETTGPMGMPLIYYDYEKDQSRAKELVLYFNFNEQ